MANARTRFDTIREYMVRSHSATSGTLYGKPCALLNGHAFLYLHQDWAAFLLKGRVRLQALALPGARFWDPLGRDGPSMDWVIVPDTHFLRWDRLAIEAVKVARAHGQGRRPTAGPVEGPPQPPPAAKRWINSIKSLFAKAAEITLAKQEPPPERTISKLFAETGADLDAGAAADIAALADADQTDAAAQPTPAAPEQGRASFAVEQPTPAAPPPPPQGRASFGVEEPAPAAPPAASGRASFAIDEADHSAPEPAPPAEAKPPTPAYSGRASFAVPDEPEPAQPAAGSPPPGAASEPTKPAQISPVISDAGGGRASFTLADQPAADQPAEPKPAAEVPPKPAQTTAPGGTGAGRASFSLAEDPPATPPEPAAPKAPPQPPPAEQSGLSLEDMEASAAPVITGRASFQVGDDPKPAGSEQAAAKDKAGAESDAAAAPADEWAEKIAKYQLEASSDEPASGAPISGRAVFSAREPDPLPSTEPKFKIKEPERSLGRASFKIADDDGDSKDDGEADSDSLEYDGKD